MAKARMIAGWKMTPIEECGEIMAWKAPTGDVIFKRPMGGKTLYVIGGGKDLDGKFAREYGQLDAAVMRLQEIQQDNLAGVKRSPRIV